MQPIFIKGSNEQDQTMKTGQSSCPFIFLDPLTVRIGHLYIPVAKSRAVVYDESYKIFYEKRIASAIA